MISGSCECRRVKFEINAGITDFSHCHCSQCRKLHGAAYATFGGVSRDGFRYVTGEGDLGVYASSAGSDRVFCTKCGSNILVEVKTEPDVLYVCMGVIDGDPPCPEGYHQYVRSKAGWHEITDELPQYDRRPPE